MALSIKLSTPEVTLEVAPEVKMTLLALDKDLARREIQSKLGLRDEKHFREKYLKRALSESLIERTIPDKPNSRLPKYRLTDKGK